FSCCVVRKARLWSLGVETVHLWGGRKEKCPTVGVSGGNSSPSLVSVGGIVSHHWYQ
ncbi:unnamed protein product, partial [Staurois parvus]